MTFYKHVKSFRVFDKPFLPKVWFLLISVIFFITPKALTYGEEMKMKKTMTIAEFELTNAIKEQMSSATLNDILLRDARKSKRFEIVSTTDLLDKIIKCSKEELLLSKPPDGIIKRIKKLDNRPDLILFPTVSFIKNEYKLTASLLDFETFKVIDIFTKSGKDIEPLITSLWEHLDPAINEGNKTSDLPKKIRNGTFLPTLRMKGLYKIYTNDDHGPRDLPDLIESLTETENFDIDITYKLFNKIHSSVHEIEVTHSEGKFDKTETLLDTLLMFITTEPKIKPAKLLLFLVWYNHGVNYSKSALGHENYQKEIYYYDKAIEADASRHEAWVNKGVALSKLNLFSEAIVCDNKAIKINPEDNDAWYNKGNALFVLERFAEAIECYDKAISIDSCDHESLKNKGVALERVGRYDEANSIWRIFPKD